ncbi:MAG: lytic transglycosylase domain-containing protein [Vulcanimicrobiaceae bacterium]
MIPRVFVFLLCVLTAGTSPSAAIATQSLQAAYARALRAYNPALSRTSANSLARATLALSDAEHLDARLLVALVATESGWHRNARSPVGARGLGQLMPRTAQALGVDPTDPLSNLAGAATQLRLLLNTYAQAPIPQRYELALAAYNAGSGAVQKYGGIPPYPETRRYVATVMARWAVLSGSAWTRH